MYTFFFFDILGWSDFGNKGKVLRGSLLFYLKRGRGVNNVLHPHGIWIEYVFSDKVSVSGMVQIDDEENLISLKNWNPYLMTIIYYT